MSKRGKLLLQLDLKILGTLNLSAKDFTQAVKEETNTFYMLLGNLLVKKVHQKGYSHCTYEVTGYDCSAEDLLKVTENCILQVPELDDERFGKRAFFRVVSYLIPDTEWSKCVIRVFNFGHGVLITFTDGYKVKYVKITPIGLKTFESRKKLGIKELV